MKKTEKKVEKKEEKKEEKTRIIFDYNVDEGGMSVKVSGGTLDIYQGLCEFERQIFHLINEELKMPCDAVRNAMRSSLLKTTIKESGVDFEEFIDRYNKTEKIASILFGKDDTDETDEEETEEETKDKEVNIDDLIGKIKDIIKKL